jgi:hypothetical protein
MDEVNAALEELSQQFAGQRTTDDDYDDDDAAWFAGSARRRRRPFMTLRLFGHTLASMSRPFYERLPPLLRALADRLLVVHKRD